MESLEFVKSSFCSGGQCVEVAATPKGVVVRDASRRLVQFTEEEWHAFVSGVKVGEFDF